MINELLKNQERQAQNNELIKSTQGLKNTPNEA